MQLYDTSIFDGTELCTGFNEGVWGINGDSSGSGQASDLTSVANNVNVDVSGGHKLTMIVIQFKKYVMSFNILSRAWMLRYSQLKVCL